MQMFCQGASSHTLAHARTHAHMHARTHNHVMEVYSIALRVVLFDQSDVCTTHGEGYAMGCSGSYHVSAQSCNIAPLMVQYHHVAQEPFLYHHPLLVSRHITLDYNAMSRLIYMHVYV